MATKARLALAAASNASVVHLSPMLIFPLALAWAGVSRGIGVMATAGKIRQELET